MKDLNVSTTLSRKLDTPSILKGNLDPQTTVHNTQYKTFNFHKKIYGYECDVYGHLNNAIYLQIYEAARAEALFEMNLPIAKLKEMNIAVFVIKAEIHYKKGILLEETVTVKSMMSSLDRLNSIWEQEIYNSNDELCSNVTIHAVFVSDNKPTRISKKLEEYFRGRALGVRHQENNHP